jgi:hypothetical protein
MGRARPWIAHNQAAEQAKSIDSPARLPTRRAPQDDGKRRERWLESCRPMLQDDAVRASRRCIIASFDGTHSGSPTRSFGLIRVLRVFHVPCGAGTPFALPRRIALRRDWRTRDMLRFTTTTLAALAISTFPLASLAETAIDQKDTEAVVVAAVEDAEPTPAPIRSEAKREKSERLVPHGSSQSEAGYRFTNPYAVPQQTLPLTFPALAVFSF